MHSSLSYLLAGLDAAGAKRLSMVPPPKELFLEAVTKVGCLPPGLPHESVLVG